MELILKYFSDFTTKQLDQLQRLEGLYKEWNEKINVISRKDIDGLYEKHVLHSLSIAVVFDFQPGTEILDLGTGGGFPGIPLAIYFPEVKFHLVDSIAKKLKVVGAIADSLGLTTLHQHARVEEIRDRILIMSVRAVPLKDRVNMSKTVEKKSGIPIPTPHYSPANMYKVRLRKRYTSGLWPYITLFMIFSRRIFTESIFLYSTLKYLSWYGLMCASMTFV